MYKPFLRIDILNINFLSFFFYFSICIICILLLRKMYKSYFREKCRGKEEKQGHLCCAGHGELSRNSVLKQIPVLIAESCSLSASTCTRILARPLPEKMTLRHGKLFCSQNVQI